MELAQAVLTLRHGWKVARVPATRVRFSAHQCFAGDGGADDRRCLRRLADHLKGCPGLAVAARDGGFLHYLLDHCPDLRGHICGLIPTGSGSAELAALGIPSADADRLPPAVRTVFLAETRAFERMQMRRRLPAELRIVDVDVLQEIVRGELPSRAWTPWSRDLIYPIDVPEIAFQPGLDLLLIDCPARNLGLMPNGVGYVHNALKQAAVRHQTCDLDILIYHRFHIRRLFDEGGTVRLPGGRALPTDPWQAEHYDLWSDPEVLAYFEPEIAEIVTKIAAARPKILALSIHACNEHFSRVVVERVKAALPEVVILVGGFSCYSADIGLRGFPLADYMCIGEADLTVGPLAERLAAGERPANTPGVLSRHDRPGTPFIPGPMPHDLDLIEHPKHEWYDLDIYRNYNGYQLTPVIASRGCRWSRCTFCAERFYWRIRSPKAFVDELEWLVGRGCRLFMFNESDLNGKPEVVEEICNEIIRRNLKVKLTAQLRIHKKGTRAYYDKMKQAGFVALRFGVDAFAENALRLQKKGYNLATVQQNLKDCWEAGIYTEVNWVIGVPGETDQDVQEGIEFILQNKRYIGRLANLNPLILVTGGVYWMEPEQHNIRFRGDKEQLYREYPRAIPAHLWYSTDPYIDENVRKERFERIVLALHEGKFDVGAWAARVIEDVQKNRDVARTGAANAGEVAGLTNPAPLDEAPAGPGLSDGVGRMERPAAADGASPLEFNADARSSAYVFRAGSALPEEPVISLRPSLFLVRHQDQQFVVAAEAMAAAFGSKRFPAPPVGGCTDLGNAVGVRLALTPAARPEYINTVGSANIVSYDGFYYVVPHVLGGIAWDREDVGALSGVFTTPRLAEAFTYAEQANALAGPGPIIPGGWARLTLFRLRRIPLSPRLLLTKVVRRGPAMLRRVAKGMWQIWRHRRAAREEQRDAAAAPAAAPAAARAAKPTVIPLKTVGRPAARSVPTLVGSLEGYNVVEYEGWYYGIPQALGPIDLSQTDLVETPGVIRDLSRDVVENEIREAIRVRRLAA